HVTLPALARLPRATRIARPTPRGSRSAPVSEPEELDERAHSPERSAAIFPGVCGIARRKAPTAVGTYRDAGYASTGAASTQLSTRFLAGGAPDTLKVGARGPCATPIKVHARWPPTAA